MWDMVRSFFIAVLLGFFTVASAQLPPKIMADKHLIHAEQLYAAQDYVEAFKVMEKIIALQKEHNLTLSDEFHLKYAKVALSVDSTRIALESVTRYLSATGEEGQFYQEALTLLLKAEGNYVMTAEDFYNEVIKTEGTCDGLPKGSSCWMELTNHPECYAWNSDLQESETWIWAGKCSGHLPEGKGTLTIEYISHRDAEGKPRTSKLQTTGSFQKGKQHGKWVSHSGFGETTYVNGIKHGYWSFRIDSSSNTDFGTREGIFLDGKFSQRQWWYGYRRTDWSVEVEGPDENCNGHLTYRNSDGDEWGGSYVNGKRHGQWSERSFWYLDRNQDTVGEGPIMEGKKHGEWVYRDPDGTVRRGSYVEGKKHGKWVDWPYAVFLGEDFYRRFVGEGSYVDGEEQGEWVYRHPNGDKLKVEWKNGYPNSTVFWYDYDEEKCWSFRYSSLEEKKKKVNKKMCLE